MKKNGKIHFIHHIEKGYAKPNLGDWICSPYYYFTDYWKRYTCILHSCWAILWHEIERDDIVIFGGGGLLDNSDQLNDVLNKVFDACDNVIIWGAGTHRYNENNIFGKKTASVKINYKKAALLGIRDYRHPSGLPYLPCVSCMNSAFSEPSKEPKIARKIGVIKSALESSFAISNVPCFVTNAQPIGVITNYIRTSSIVFVSSYHGAYWSMLLGRPAILPITRIGVDKYKFFRHSVEFYEGDSFNEKAIEELASSLPSTDGFLAESRRLNLEFFEKCRAYIEDRIQFSFDPDTLHVIQKRNAQLEFTIVDMWNEICKLKGRLSIIERTCNPE